MNNVVHFPDAQLKKLAQTVNAETVRNQARHIIAVEDALRHLVYCVEHGIAVDSERVEAAKRLIE